MIAMLGVCGVGEAGEVREDLVGKGKGRDDGGENTLSLFRLTFCYGRASGTPFQIVTIAMQEAWSSVVVVGRVPVSYTHLTLPTKRIV